MNARRCIDIFKIAMQVILKDLSMGQDRHTFHHITLTLFEFVNIRTNIDRSQKVDFEGRNVSSTSSLNGFFAQRL